MSDATLIETLLDKMVERGASDLYLKSNTPPMIRVDGQLDPVAEQTLDENVMESIVDSLLLPEQKVVLKAEKEFNFAHRSLADNRFRVNIYYQRGELGMVFRHVKGQIPTIESLNLPIQLGEIVLKRQGFFIISGPTGSGKSTTLAAMLDYRNQCQRGHIITIEDPIEFIYEDKQSIISQREVGLDTKTFKNALKNALRQAPDVISIGEIRDLETAMTAMTMAETGHMVLATLHSANTYQSLERLVSLFTSEREQHLLMMLAMNLSGILSQRLIPMKSGEGRVVATELMLAGPRVKELILTNQIKEIHALLKRGGEEGVHSFDQSIYELYEQGLISDESALHYADNRGELKMRLSGFKGSIKQV